ncbi:MAG: aspartate dehydrogenase [Burkholderiales bacterium]|nr:aspartate dehydrogenase [Burkholderiales bacterium]
MKLALIGVGGLGRIVAGHLGRDPAVQVVAVAARAHQREAVRALLGDVPMVASAGELLACRPDVVVECASHGAFRHYAEPVLAAGIDLIAVSVGVLADAGYRERVLAAAAASGANLEIPAGAIGAIDVVAAARTAGLARVSYSTRKSPRAWSGTPAERMLDLAAVRSPTLFFDENAERAALVFTEKANVCATLALAGLGFERTRVQFWVDPAVDKSVHHVEAEGACGLLEIELANNVAPSDGKASVLTAMSILRAVRNRAAVLRI